MPNVYDDERRKQHTSNDELRHLTGINAEQEAAHDREAHRGAADDILGRENEAAGDRDSRPDLRSQKGLKDPSIANGRNLAKQASDDERNAEATAKKGAAISNTDLRQAEKDGAILGKGYTGSGKDSGPPGKLRNFRARFKNDNAFKKKVMMAAAGSGLATAVVVAIIVLFLLVSMFKIPGLAQNIVNFQFARMSRQFQQATTRTTEEAIGVEGASDAAAGSTAEEPGGLFGALKEKYGNVKDGLFDKIDGVLPGDTTIGSLNTQLNTLLPSRVIQNLQDSKGLSFQYTYSKYTGRPILEGMNLDGEFYPLEQADGIAKWTPILKNVVGFKNQVKFSSQALPALQDAMTDSDVAAGTTAVGIAVRGAVARELRQQAGINLIAWNVSRFVGKDPTQARLEEEEEKVDAVQNATNEADAATTSEIAQAQQDAQTQAETDAQDPNTLQTIINDGGVDQNAINDTNKDLSSDLDTEAANLADPFFSLTVAACIIYDGSVQQSGPTVNNQTTQEEASFYYVSSAADQQKAGSQNDTVGQSFGLANAIGATNDDLGDVSTSNAYIRANGGTVDTTANIGAEAGSDGSYTFSVLDALGITSPTSVAGRLVNWIIGHGCKVLTNTAVGIGIGVAGIVSSIVSFGGTEAGAEALSEGAGTFMRAYVNHIIDSIFVKGVLDDGVTRNLLQKATTFGYKRALPYIFKQGTILGATIGATVLAHMITAARADEFFSGFNQGTDLANEADAGGNFTSNQMEQTQLFGRPLLENEVCTSNQDDMKYIGWQTSQQTAFNRYVNPDNAESLLSQTAVAVTGQMNTTGLNNFMTLGTMLFRPYAGMNYFLNALTGISHAAAATNCNANSTDYGQVQFGWSDDEENLIDSSASYMPLENQQILDESGEEDTIAQTYAVCFGYDWNPGGDGSLDPTDPNGDLTLNVYGDGSIGSLLASGDIQRDTNGNVLDQGLCSKDHLSYDDTADAFATDNDPTSPEQHDLVFRWRLAMQYDTTVDEEIGMQNVTAD